MLVRLAGALLSRTSIARELIAKLIQTRTIDSQSIEYGMDPEMGTLAQITTCSRNLLNNARPYRNMSLLFGLIGCQATFAYDVLSNFGALVFKSNWLYQLLAIGLLTAVP